MQYPTSTQGFNRYTYVNNNPLSHSDPSGYFSLKKVLGGLGADSRKYGGLIASVAGGVMCIGAGPACAVLAGAGSGAIGGFLSAGSLKGAFNGAVIGFAAAGMSYQIGEAFSGVAGSTMALTKGVSHGVTQGAFGMLRGGRFEDSFSAAFVASLVGPAIENVGNAASRIVMSSMIGGTVSVIGGGKFAPGAISAAFVQAFNEEGGHNEPNAKEMVKEELNGIQEQLGKLKEILSPSTGRRTLSSETHAAGSVEGKLDSGDVVIDVSVEKKVVETGSLHKCCKLESVDQTIEQVPYDPDVTYDGNDVGVRSGHKVIIRETFNYYSPQSCPSTCQPVNIKTDVYGPDKFLEFMKAIN